MRKEEVVGLLERRPFQPLRITLSDGRVVEVRRRELTMTGRSVVAIGVPRPGDPEPIYDRLIITSYQEIAKIESAPLPAAT